MKQNYIPLNQRPYIGITDFTSLQQVKRMLGVLRQNRLEESAHRLHVGVMMSRKTLHCLPTKWADVFPPKEDITQIFSLPEKIVFDKPNDCHDWMFTLHYADYGSPPDLFDDLSRAMNYAGPFFDAIQLDMPWPDPGVIANAAHASRKNPEIILQIGGNAFEEVDNDVDRVVEKLYPYHTFISHVLLDKSMGRGLGMDAEALAPFASAIAKEYPKIQLVFAGGLGPNSLNLLDPLLSEFPNMSIDAQGQLRPSGSALDPIDWNMAEEYLVGALKKLG